MTTRFCKLRDSGTPEKLLAYVLRTMPLEVVSLRLAHVRTMPLEVVSLRLAHVRTMPLEVVVSTRTYYAIGSCG